eukprot:scaffold32288_cov101-Isochrysis_galbana.AAC.2
MTSRRWLAEALRRETPGQGGRCEGAGNGSSAPSLYRHRVRSRARPQVQQARSGSAPRLAHMYTGFSLLRDDQLRHRRHQRQADVHNPVVEQQGRQVGRRADPDAVDLLNPGGAAGHLGGAHTEQLRPRAGRWHQQCGGGEQHRQHPSAQGGSKGRRGRADASRPRSPERKQKGCFVFDCLLTSPSNRAGRATHAQCSLAAPPLSLSRAEGTERLGRVGRVVHQQRNLGSTQLKPL